MHVNLGQGTILGTEETAMGLQFRIDKASREAFFSTDLVNIL